MATAVLMMASGISFIGVTVANATAPVIASTSTVPAATDNPTIEITSTSTFAAANPNSWTLDRGTSGLSTGQNPTVSLMGSTVTITLPGSTGCGGTFTLTALQGAFSPSASANSNTLTFTVPTLSPCVTDKTLNIATSKIKGVSIASLGTPASLNADIVPGSITLTSAQASNTSNSGSFVTTFVRTEPGVRAPSVRKYPSGTTNFSVIDVYDGTSAISNGEIFRITVRSDAPGPAFFYNIVVTVSDVASTPAPSTPTLTAAEIAAAAATAAKAAAEAAAAVRAAEVAAAQTKLSTVLKADKAGTIDEYKSANINISTAASLARVNAEVLKLSANDRADFSKIKAIADKIEFDESFFNATARPTLSTYAKYEVVGVTERILPTINTKVLELPAALRVDAKAIQDLVKVESFVDRVANPATRSTVSATALVSRGLLTAEYPRRHSVVNGLAGYPEGSLNTMAKIEAAIAEQIFKAEAPKRRLAEIKAKIAARKR